jgi:hypothetical protein
MQKGQKENDETIRLIVFKTLQHANISVGLKR